MQVSYQDARQGKPWSLTGLMHSQLDVLDEEGRPLGEIRATSRVKDGVPMLLKACPYHDARKGHPMNVSALEQITSQLKVVEADLVGFAHALDSLSPSRGAKSQLHAFFCGILDQLLAPHRALLHPKAVMPVTARAAVSHKLAAGYSAVTLSMIEQEAAGQVSQIDADTFLDYITQSKALFGASEVCAGPPNMIERITRTWMSPPASELPAPASEEMLTRVQVSEIVCAQVLLGRALSLYDQIFERALLGNDHDLLVAKNPFMEKKLSERERELAEMPLPSRQTVERLIQFAELDPTKSRRLRTLVHRPGCAPKSELCLTLQDVVERGVGALKPASGKDRVTWCQVAGAYLEGLRGFIATQWELEMVARRRLALDSNDAVELSAVQVPRMRSRDWIEALLGFRVHIDVSANPQFQLRRPGGRTEVIDVLSCAPDSPLPAPSPSSVPPPVATMVASSTPLTRY